MRKLRFDLFYFVFSSLEEREHEYMLLVSLCETYHF